MHQPNDHFRLAREAIPSARTPGEGLSRQEVAELANEWIYRHRHKVVELDANYIGKLERGIIRWPSRWYRDAFRAVLRAESDAQLGFHGHRRRPGTVKDVDRQQFLRTTAAVAALPWLELFSPLERTPAPSKVGLNEVEQVRAAAAWFDQSDNAHGGGLARDAVFAQLRHSARLLHAECTDKVRTELFAAVAELGGVAGFTAFDAGAHDDARRAYQFSLSCAEQAGDWHLRAAMLSMLARQAVWCGRPDEGLTFAELALVRAERLTASERASAYTMRARAYAKSGSVQECLAAVGAADDAFARSSSGTETPAMAWYDHAQHHGDTGHALFDLAVRGRKTEATRRLAYSIAHHTAEYARSRVMSQIKLASLIMATGDPRQAAATGSAVLTRAGSIHSRRVADDLQELDRFAARHATISEVNDLRAQLRDHLAGS